MSTEPAAGVRDHATLVVLAPFARAENATDCPAVTVATAGVTESETVVDVEDPLLGISDITALADWLESLVLIAFRMTVCGPAMVLGAV
ncbi:MAG TPA: hypothetical protein VEV17_09655 [Bryobacteraceae bacterium]|nr:hypothetical protein [Bryobacteraceae bacterium]